MERADWKKAENAWDALWSSALIIICALADDVLIIHSTRNVDNSSAFCAKKKNLKLGDCPPDAMQCLVEGKFVGSTPTGCLCDLPIKKIKIMSMGSNIFC